MTKLIIGAFALHFVAAIVSISVAITLFGDDLLTILIGAVIGYAIGLGVVQHWTMSHTP
jgi:hypothetical protein